MPHIDSEDSTATSKRATRYSRIRQAATLVTITVVSAALVWLVTSRSALSEVPEQSIGYVEVEPRPAPDFRIHRIGGGTLTLTEHLEQGKPVVLNLWASWCIPCREEMPAIDHAARQHTDVAFVGVAVQDTEMAAMTFATGVDVSFPLGIDDGSVMAAYPTVGLPTTWFIDRVGIIVGTRFGEMSESELDSRTNDLRNR